MITRRVRLRQHVRKAYLDGGGHEELWEWLRAGGHEDSGDEPDDASMLVERSRRPHVAAVHHVCQDQAHDEGDTMDDETIDRAGDGNR